MIGSSFVPLPESSVPEQQPRAPAPDSSWGNGDFQAAFNDAQRRSGQGQNPPATAPHSRKAQPNDAKADQKHAGSKRKARGADGEATDRTGEGSSLAGLLHKAPADGAPSALAELMAPGERPAQTAAVVIPESARVDPQAFADVLQQLTTAPAAAGKTTQVGFTDQSWPITGVELGRAADGSMSLTLTASGYAVPQVSKTLEALRRRLEAKGLNVGEMTVEPADDGEGPVYGL